MGNLFPKLIGLTAALLLLACGNNTGNSGAADPTPDAGHTTNDDLGGNLADTKEPSPPSIIEGRECPPDNTTTYDNTGGPFLLSWCVGCHSSQLPDGQRAGAPVGVDFDTPEAIESHLLRIFARSADTHTTMPPVDAITAAERHLLGDWIACGAPGLEEAIVLSIAPETPEPVDNEPSTGNGCTSDEDCEGQCKGSKTGCVCVSKGQNKVCLRPCTTDDDCPKPPNGAVFVCGQNGICGKK